MTRPRPGVALLLFLRSARLQRRRATLTVMAIAWSCLSLLLLLAFGEGLKRQVWRGTVAIGTDLAVIWSGETSQPWRGLASGRSIRPRVEDLTLLRQRVTGARGIIGEMRNFRVGMTHGDRTVNGPLVGTNFEYGAMRNHIAQAGGRFLGRRDEREKRRVIFLGDELAEELFDAGTAPVGETLLVGGVPYTVIGVMRRKLQAGNYGGPDAKHAVVPLSTFRMQYGWRTLSNIVVQSDGAAGMPLVLAEVFRVLGSKYGFDPGDSRALTVWNTVETSRLTRNILVGVQIFLGIVGGLTLVIGAVGVANIMYAVVKERTREIGMKMALGARRGWIVGPLVLEALVVTLVGGLLGLLLALAAITLVGFLPTEGNMALEFLGKPTLSVPIGLVTAVILGLAGLLAGYFPARRAASIEPARALRYE